MDLHVVLRVELYTDVFSTLGGNAGHARSPLYWCSSARNNALTTIVVQVLLIPLAPLLITTAGGGLTFPERHKKHAYRYVCASSQRSKVICYRWFQSPGQLSLQQSFSDRHTSRT